MKKIKFLITLALATCLVIVTSFGFNRYNASFAGGHETGDHNHSMEGALSVDVYYAEGKAAMVASTLIKGETDAILVDSQYVLSEGAKVADWVEASGKNLKAIWISHPHPDHFLGLEAVLEAFPDTPVYSTADVVAVLEQRAETYAQRARANYGDDATSNPVIPQVYDQDFLELEGQQIEIIPMQGDAAKTAVLKVPEIDTVIAPDVIYWGIYGFMLEVPTPELRSAWIESLDMIEAMNPKKVIPGHKAPELSLEDSLDGISAMRSYIETYGTAVENNATVDEARAEITAAFPDYQLPFLLEMSLNAAYAS